MSVKKKILFVCSQNRLRSPTAEKLYGGRIDLEVQSAGLDKSASRQLDRELLEWADQVFVFERRQRNQIQKLFRDVYARKKIECLYIPDEYDYMDPVLIAMLRYKLRHHIGNTTEEDTAA
jgi:predicted protein tyrosine phosphatase